MKKFWLGGVAFFLLSAGIAGATDLPMKAPVYKVADPFSWEGVYIGANAGYAWGSDKSEYGDSGGITATSALNPRGGFGGIQAGYNRYLLRNWVLGYEIDFAWGDIKSSGLASDATPTSSKIDYFGTARSRIGYAADHWLVYATGGLAWAHNRFIESNPGTPGDSIFTRNQFNVGWAAGAGFEYAFDRNWSVKAEYLHADFGKAKDETLPAALTVSRFTEQTMNLVRVGVNYRFDGSAPSLAATSGYPVKARALTSASPWSGSYLGVHAGYGWGKFDAFDSVGVPAPQTSSLDPVGGFGGFQFGYNWRVAPRWVVGLESETSFGSLTDSGVSSPNAFATKAKVGWLDSERVRIGFLAMDSMLIYGTGGLALAHEKFGEINGAGMTVMSLDHYRVGWTAGGGLEYAWSPVWSAKVEYLYSDVGGYRDTRSTGRTADLTMNMVKVGINYHGPVLELLTGGR